MEQLGNYFSALFELITRAYRLDPAALAWVRDHPYSIWLTVGVALLAGISVMLGHAVVLLLNRITGWRFVLGLLLSAVWLVLLLGFESVVLWGLGSWAGGNPVPYLTVLSGVLLSTAPQIWGFLVLMPYLGTAVGRFLSAWSAVVLWAVTAGTFNVSRWSALALVTLSWLAMHLLSTLSAPWISRATASILKRVSGRSYWVSGADVLSGRPMLTEEVHA